jgi:hypothetical protein
MSILTILGTFLGGRVKDVVGGATANGNTLKKLEDRIIVLEQSAGNPLFVISGQVTGAVQNAIAVELRDDASNTLLQTVTTNGTGNYAFSGRVAGTYKVIPVLAGYTFTPATPVIALSGATTQDFTSSAAAGIPKAGNLVAWWKLDEASGTRVNSVNPGTHDLQPVGTIQSVVGKLGNAATNFGAAAGVLKAPHSPAFYVNQDFSIQSWVRIDANYFGQPVIGLLLTKKVVSPSPNYDFYFGGASPNTISFSQNTGSGTIGGNFTLIENLVIGTWYQVIVTHNLQTKTFTLYLNNILQDTITYTGTLSTLPSGEIGLGSEPEMSSQEPARTIDDTAFWNAELDAADVAALYNGGAGITP